MILSCCVNINAYNVFLLGLYLPRLLPFLTLIIWYGETMTRAACLILHTMNCTPPNPIIPATKNFMRQMIKGLTRHSNRLVQWLKRTYLLMLLLQVPTLTLSKPCCLRAGINDIVNLIPFDDTRGSIVALDNCATNHIFGDESDFHGGIIPMDPIDVTGLGDGTATGYGNIKLEFTGDNGEQ